MQNYLGSVPAVQRAIAVLEHLRVADGAPTLTELSQALGLNRSSLLAILNTLRTADFVSRDEADRYHLGPGLLPYGPTVARTTGPAEAFDRPAQWLVNTLGESVALIRLSHAGAVCVAFKTGRHNVRAMMEPGQMTPVEQSAGGLAIVAAGDGGGDSDGSPPAGALALVRKCGCAYIEHGTEPGQAGLAAPVCDAAGQAVAAIELLAPSFRLHASDDSLHRAGQLVIAAARHMSLALGCQVYAPYRPARMSAEPWRGTRAAGLHGPELEAFLHKPWVASLACLQENGYPYLVPVWYEWRRGSLWLAPRSGARWAAYLRNLPRASVTISEPSPPFRRVLIEGQAKQARHGAAALARRLAERYLGPYATSYLATAGDSREPPIQILPDKITSWQGLTARDPAGDREPRARQAVSVR